MQYLNVVHDISWCSTTPMSVKNNANGLLKKKTLSLFTPCYHDAWSSNTRVFTVHEPGYYYVMMVWESVSYAFEGAQRLTHHINVCVNGQPMIGYVHLNKDDAITLEAYENLTTFTGSMTISKQIQPTF